MEMEVITWSFPHKGNAEKCYRECQTLSEITPENVLNLARDEKTELHKCFEFDDAIAGEKYRLIQARDIIRHFVIKHTNEKGEEQNIRTFQITTETNRYESTIVILKNPDEYAALLSRAKDELRNVKRRYKTLSELEEVFEAIDKL